MSVSAAVTGPHRLAGEVFTLHGTRVITDAEYDRLLSAGSMLRDGSGPAPPSSSPAAPVIRVSGRTEALLEHSRDLPSGPAGAEALAARLRRLGAQLEWGEPEAVPTVVDLLALLRDWGAGSVQTLRIDSSLLGELAVGRWFDASFRARAVRRVARPVGAGRALVGRGPRRAARLRAAADTAFWRGVRSAASVEEWRRLTSGYTVLLYHRLSGELKPGQERLDVPPARFDAQMRLLQRLRFRSLTIEELVACHASGGPALPRRGVLVTADDAFQDVVEPLRRHAALHPLLLVPTAAVGRPAPWLGGEWIASWQELASLAGAGVGLGGHSRTHPDLTAVSSDALESEIRGSADDLRRELDVTPLAFAYPHGRSGPREREATEAAGYPLAFTTATGRNGAGTDRYSLRRVSVKAWDSRLSFAWKALTGEQPPLQWERWLVLRQGIARRLARARRSSPLPAPAASKRSAEQPPRRAP